MISISCLESKLLNNNNWYGRFQLAPFQKGEGLTVANALRRTLLAEKSNFFITWVDFYNAEIPYSVLTGMRESIFDILLNLKQVIFTSDKIIPNSSNRFKTLSIHNFRAQKKILKDYSVYAMSNNINNQAKPKKKKRIIGSYLSASPIFSTLERKQDQKNIKTFNDFFPINHVLKSSSNQRLTKVLPETKKNKIKTLKYDLKNQKKRWPIGFRIFEHEPKNHSKIVHDLNGLNYGYLHAPNVFCENQILGKTINYDKKSCLVPLKIFRKNSDLTDPIFNNTHSKSDSTYTGYICAKGPAIIYAKNIKLPKGLKCVDPDKYIVTLADDGLFYLRFALQGPEGSISSEIKNTLNTSNIPIRINQGIKFNTVKRKTFPKSRKYKTIESSFSLKATSMAEKNNNNKVGKIKSYSKNLIKSQGLLLTNDSVKQFNFQNTSIIANIQKTCLLNLQIKHYYYKSGRFDRFLFDLLKRFKPIIQSTYYDERFKTVLYQTATSLKSRKFEHDKYNKLSKFYHEHFKSKIFFKPIKAMTYRFLKKFSSSCVYIFLSETVSKKIIWPSVKPSVFQKKHYRYQNYGCFKCFFWSFYTLKKHETKNKDKTVLNVLKKTHLLEKLSKISCLKNNINGFSSILKFFKITPIFNNSLKNTYFGSYLLKWQKTFKSLKTNSIYDYLQKLSTSEAAILPITHTKMLLAPKLVSTRGPKNTLYEKTISVTFRKHSKKNAPRMPLKTHYNDLWLSGLHEPYIEKFGNLCVSFQCFKTHILSFLQYQNSLHFTNTNPVSLKHTLRPRLANNFYSEKLISKIKWLRHWSFLSIKHSQETKILMLKKKIRLFFSVNNLFWSVMSKLVLPFYPFSVLSSPSNGLGEMPFVFSKENTDTFKKDCFIYYKTRLLWKPRIKPVKLLTVLSSINEKEISKDDNHLRRFYYLKKSLVTKNSINWFLKRLTHSIESGYISYNFNFQKLFSDQKKIKSNHQQLWIVSENPFKTEAYNKFWRPAKLSTNLRAKSDISIRQVSYKPKWRLTYQQNTCKFLLNNLDYYTNQNKPACFDGKNVKRVNSISNNNVVLKPIYLNVEQIIYILKQTSKFRKNTRLNSVFFNTSNLLHNLNVKRLFTNKWLYVFPKRLMVLNQRVTESKFPSSVNGSTFKTVLNGFKPGFVIWILGNNYIFKPKLSYRLKNQNDLLENKNFLAKRWCFNATKKKNTFLRSTHFTLTTNDTKLELQPKSELTSFPKHFQRFDYYNKHHSSDYEFLQKKKIPMCFQRFNKVTQENLTTSNYFYPSKIAGKPKNNLSPYNLNVYNSKISFNLRYTYPFKYTIFETVLPFLNKPSFNEYGLSKPPSNLGSTNTKLSVLNYRTSTISFDYPKESGCLKENTNHDSRISYDDFDYIQYNESFKIYTTLAYTCLKTYEPRLPKYYNVNRLYKKKNTIKPLVYESPISVIGSAFYYFKTLETFKCFNNLSFKPYLFKYIKHTYFFYHDQEKNKKNPLQKYYKKPSTFLMVSNPTVKTNFLFSQNKLVNTFNQKLDWYRIHLKKPLSYRLNHKIFLEWYFLNKHFLNETFKTIKPFFNVKQNIISKYISKITLVNYNDDFDNLLPNIFNGASKWRIMNNFNFNDAFIVIPCMYLNYQLANSSNQTKPVSNLFPFSLKQKLTRLNREFTANLFYLFVPIVQDKFYMNYFFQKYTETTFLNDFSQAKHIIKNKLYWSNMTNKKRLLKKNTKHLNKTSVNSKKAILVSKSNRKTCLKKLAINFENLYYKNFLWNSRKITLRILNNAILPLVANRKYSISDTLPKKNYHSRFINNNVPINVSLNFQFSTPFVYDHQRKSFISLLSAFNPNLNQKILHTTKEKFKNTITLGPNRQFFENFDGLNFYCLTHKTLGTTNFMCSKTYPHLRNENRFKNHRFANQKKNLRSHKSKRTAIKSALSSVSKTVFQESENKSINNWQTPFFSSFESLRSNWRPFFSGSLKHFQEKDTSQFVHLAPLQQNENNEKYLLSQNQITPEKLTSLRKHKYTKKSIQAFKSSDNSNNELNNNVNVKSPLINNLWKSSFFCNYLFYAISTKSDVFLQHLVLISQNLNSNNSRTPNKNNNLPTNYVYPKNLEAPFFFKDPQELQTSVVDFQDVEKTQRKVPFFKKKKNTNSLEKHIILKTQEDRQLYQDEKKKDYLKSYDQTVQKIYLSQDNTLNLYFSYDYYWQKAISLAILRRFKKPSFYNHTKIKRQGSIDFSTNQNSRVLKNKYSVQVLDGFKSNHTRFPYQRAKTRLKNYEQYFGNPLRRYTSEKWCNFYEISTHKKFTKDFRWPLNKPPSSLSTKNDGKWTISEHRYLDGLEKTNYTLKSWKFIIGTAETDIYFCFHYPLFIQNCNLPWFKSKSVFGIFKSWLNKTTVDFTQDSKIIPMNCKRFSYTQLSSSMFCLDEKTKNAVLLKIFKHGYSNKTHQTFSGPSNQFDSHINNKLFENFPSFDMQIQNQGNYKIVSYFTIKESLNYIYKVNYIVESNQSKLDSLDINYNENNKVTGAPISMEHSSILKRFENLQRNSVMTDSLNVSNFLNGIYSFAPSKTIMLNSFNELTDSQRNIENENEYIQIDIWTNGEISPRQALLNAFRKLFELFYNLSKYNCLKPIEI